MTNDQLKALEQERDRLSQEVAAEKKSIADKRDEIGKLSARCTMLNVECKVAAGPLQVKSDQVTFLSNQIAQEKQRRLEEEKAVRQAAEAKEAEETARRAAEEAAATAEAEALVE